MKTKKNKPQRAIDTIRLTLNSAATALNTDRRTLQKRLQAIGVDCGRGKSFTVQELFRAVVSEYSEARTRVSRAMAERIEHENRVRAGEMLPASEIQRGVMAAVAGVFAELDRVFVNELPPVLLGLPTPLEISQHCKRAIGELKDRLRTLFAEIGKSTTEVDE